MKKPKSLLTGKKGQGVQCYVAADPKPMTEDDAIEFALRIMGNVSILGAMTRGEFRRQLRRDHADALAVKTAIERHRDWGNALDHKVPEDDDACRPMNWRRAAGFKANMHWSKAVTDLLLHRVMHDEAEKAIAWHKVQADEAAIAAVTSPGTGERGRL